jgi:hypothetical protein
MRRSNPPESKPPFPPALLIANALATVGIALSLAEWLPKPQARLGIIPPELVPPLFGMSVVVAAYCLYQITSIVRRRARARAGGGRGG